MDDDIFEALRTAVEYHQRAGHYADNLESPGLAKPWRPISPEDLKAIYDVVADRQHPPQI